MKIRIVEIESIPESFKGVPVIYDEDNMTTLTEQTPTVVGCFGYITGIKAMTNGVSLRIKSDNDHIELVTVDYSPQLCLGLRCNYLPLSGIVRFWNEHNREYTTHIRSGF
jgi:hypothetical protein